MDRTTSIAGGAPSSSSSPRSASGTSREHRRRRYEGTFTTTPTAGTTTTTTTTATEAALRDALSQNLRVQSEVAARIRKIAVMKRDNRSRASDAMLRLQLEWREEDRRRTPVDRHHRPRQFYVDLTKRLNRMERQRVKMERERQRQERQRRRDEEGGEGDDEDEEEPEIAKAKRYHVDRVVDKWTDDGSDCCRWNLRYFVDPTGSAPEPNSDTVRRRMLEGDAASFLEGRRTNGGKVTKEKRSMTRAGETPWSEEEVESLIAAVEEARRPRPMEVKRAGDSAVRPVGILAGDIEGAIGETGEASAACASEASAAAEADDVSDAAKCSSKARDRNTAVRAPIDAVAGEAVPDDGVDFEKVAELLSLESCRDASNDDDGNMKKKRKGGSSGGEEVVAARRRTPSECRDKLLSLSFSTSTSATATAKNDRRSERWTPEEARRLAELVRRNDDGRDRWDRVASDLGTDRTAWECFRYYQTNLNPNLMKERIWTAEEDELLFKYVAARGPRYLADSSASTGEIARSLFPDDRSAKQVYRRANRSILASSAQLSSGGGGVVGGGEGGDSGGRKWSDEEERRLVLCMRVYRDAGPSAIRKATAHFPGRDSGSVWEKWHRSLNPEYTFRQWTEEEDEQLLDAVVRERAGERIGTVVVTDVDGDGGGPAGTWMEISGQFPSRHPRSLKRRWVHLTTREQGRPLGRDGEAVRARGVAARQKW